MIVGEASYDFGEPTIDSQIVRLKASNADVFMNFSLPKYAAQAIKKIGELDWKPTHYLNNVSTRSARCVARRARQQLGTDPRRFYFKDPTDPQWSKKGLQGMGRLVAFMKKYYPTGIRR